ncbi:LysR family transcriptional regulator [Ammoniphilus sp. 3BR4]|uniref:LysR family transcriptional regulator n=1 Tax=Ammoniphilus sp. 3BR4 TaxID=3158265 RepID=UPI00346500DA
MEEKDWNMLITIHEERSISKAAERLYITQPSLTYRLQQIEKEFDTKIVTRGKKGVEFTTQGEYLVQFAKEMIFKLRTAKEFISNLDDRVKGKLRLGVSRNFARYNLSSLLKGFHDQYPEVDIHLKTGWSSEIIHMLYKEEVHIGIVRGDYRWQEQKYLMSEDCVCIVSKEELSLDQLPMLPRINFDTDQSLKTLIDNWWRETFTRPPTITMEVDHIETCKQLVISGLGYAILPGMSILKEDNLFSYKLKTNENEPILRKTWMIYRDHSLDLNTVNSFVDFTKKFI